MAPREKKEDMLIINRRTGKALTAEGGENGSIVIQSAATGEDSQLWTPVKAGMAIKLVNKHSGKVLDVTHGSTEAGSWAQIWDDVADGDSQLWQLVKVTATYKKLMNVQSGKVLDIVEMREDDGAPAQIWDDVDGVGQQWKFVDPAVKETPVQAEEDAPAPEKAAPKKLSGRKPKAAPAQPAPANDVEEISSPAAEPSVPAPKRRGRKPKAAEPAAAEPAPKRRGRKPKAQA